MKKPLKHEGQPRRRNLSTRLGKKEAVKHGHNLKVTPPNGTPAFIYVAPEGQGPGPEVTSPGPCPQRAHTWLTAPPTTRRWPCLRLLPYRSRSRSRCRSRAR